jgi:hypothetical protein
VQRFAAQLDRDPRRQSAAMLVFLLFVEYERRVRMSCEPWGPRRKLAFFREVLRQRSEPEAQATLAALDDLHWRSINVLGRDEAGAAILGPPLSDQQLSAGLLAIKKQNPRIYRELRDLADRAQHLALAVVPTSVRERIPKHRWLPQALELSGEADWWGKKAKVLRKELGRLGKGGPEFVDKESYDPNLPDRRREAKVRGWLAAVAANKQPNTFARFEEEMTGGARAAGSTPRRRAARGQG